MRSRLFVKLLVSLIITFGFIIGLMMGVVNWSFQRGFVSYLQQQEVQKVDDLAQQLALLYNQKQHRKGSLSWGFMQGNSNVWHQALVSAFIDAPPAPPHLIPGPKNNPNRSVLVFSPGSFHEPPLGMQLRSLERPGAKYPTDEGRPLGHRIRLVDLQKNHVFGPKQQFETSIVNQVTYARWQPIQTEGKTIGWLQWYQVGIVSSHLAHSFMQQQTSSFIFVGLAALILSVVVASLWTRILLRPVDKLVSGLKRLVQGDYPTDIPIIGHDELASMTHHFNVLAKVLRQNEQLRRQWVADISHELRTPLSVISGEVEAMLDGIRKPDQQRLASLYINIGGLAMLVDDLHQLAMSDQGHMDMTTTKIEVHSLISDLMNVYRPRMLARGLTLKYNNNQCAVILGDSGRLIQLFANLMENSIRYTDEGGYTEVCMSLESGRVRVDVRDTSPCVPASSLEKIFSRLYRVDESRSRIEGGAGLGLSICKNIVEAHGGSIQAANNSLGGLTLTVFLPLASTLSPLSNDPNFNTIDKEEVG
jgi:two-component system sensor histidine kinase BaeS